MGAYKRKLKKTGTKWWYSGQHQGVRYHSQAVYKTKAEALKAERAKIIQIEEELISPTTDITFLDLATRRLDYLKTARSKRYFVQNRLTFRRYAKQWGKLSTAGISRQMVHDALTKRGNDLLERGYGLHAVNLDLRHLKALFNYGIEELEICPGPNPVRRIKQFAVEQSVKYIPPDHDIAAVLLAAEPWQKAYIQVVKNTLARSIEVNRLKVEDVDFNNQRVRLWSRKTRNQNLVPRWVGMNIVLADALAVWFRQRDDKNPWVFYNQNGSPLTQYQKWLKKLCATAGVKNFGFHNLRHRGATLLLKSKKLDIQDLMEILGHSNVETTMRYIQSLKLADGNMMEGV